MYFFSHHKRYSGECKNIMSLKTFFDGIKYEFSQYKQNNQQESKEIVFEDQLYGIQFSDISASVPDKYFLIGFEPLYSFYRIIKGKNIAQLSSSCSRESYLSELLDKLFVKKEIGMKQLYFSDFSGLVNSKESGYFSFEEFKNQQYERNLYDLYYKDYDSLRYDVFNTDRAGNTNSIKNAIILKWSHSVFADNRDRSHRFGLLCKWSEVENLNDSEMFNVRELSINSEIKKEFLDNYFCFMVSDKTASDIFKTYRNNSFMNKQIPCFLNRTSPGKIVGIIFENKKENQRIIDFFMQSKNCMFINSLLEK